MIYVHIPYTLYLKKVCIFSSIFVGGSGMVFMARLDHLKRSPEGTFRVLADWMHEAIGREMGSVNHCGQCHLFGIC